MPWNVSGAVERRKEFVADSKSGEWTMSQLCRIYGISRVTGYAVLERCRKGGESSLEERSRAPLRHPNQTPERSRGWFWNCGERVRYGVRAR